LSSELQFVKPSLAGPKVEKGFHLFASVYSVSEEIPHIFFVGVCHQDLCFAEAQENNFKKDCERLFGEV